MSEVTGIPIEKIDAAAEYLFNQIHRQRQNDPDDRPSWATVSKRTQRKWRSYAWACLIGAQQWERANDPAS